MGPSEKITRLTLMYMGLIPFIGLSYAAALPYSAIISPQTALLALSGYSSIILTFLAGCLWQHSSKGIMVLSNIIALFAWLSCLTPLAAMAWTQFVFSHLASPGLLHKHSS